MAPDKKRTLYIQVDSTEANIKEKNPPTRIGENTWTVETYLDDNDYSDFLAVRVRCNENVYSNLWSCNASVRVLLREDSSDEPYKVRKECSKTFTHDDDELDDKIEEWDKLTNPGNKYLFHEKYIRLLVEITVHSTTGWKTCHFEQFDTPTQHLTDVVLVVDGKKFHVSKQVLAMQSKYFHTLFFGDFKEKSEEEVTIGDVNCYDFCRLLNFVYPSTQEFSKYNIDVTLRLADRFEFWSVTERACEFLKHTTEVNVIDKLEYAEMYNLASLQKHCLDSFATLQEIFVAANQNHYRKLSDATLSLMFQRGADLMEKGNLYSP
ncbi:hypothetical protein CAEBREN_25676 [Caenorhabditis brenneri]|uniref:BTB domain-containing protein n=1 Tax=Caenorhabditis brenneri TaxID=135651 RepID=G0MVZ9_CAEBE|nr:hypothetical protein CAEBREN_25676 [Caenorhabditis brenneri]